MVRSMKVWVPEKENFLSSWIMRNCSMKILHHRTNYIIKHVHTLSIVDWDHHYWHMIWGFVCIQLSVGAAVILHTEHLAMKALSHELRSCHLTAQTQIHEEPIIRTTCYQLEVHNLLQEYRYDYYEFGPQ